MQLNVSRFYLRDLYSIQHNTVVSGWPDLNASYLAVFAFFIQFLKHQHSS